MRQRSRLVIVVLALVLGLYVASFWLPAILFCSTSSQVRPPDVHAGHLVRSGAKMAFISLFGPFLLNFAILANPLLIAGSTLLILRRTRSAVRCLGFAVLCSLQTFQTLFSGIPEDEGVVMRSFMVRPLAGWYCWFGAILLAFLLALYLQAAESREAAVNRA